MLYVEILVVHMLSFLAWLVPIIITIKVARTRRANCSWSLEKTRSQVWISIPIIILSEVVYFTTARPFSLVLLLAFALELFAVYRLSTAIFRKKDLANKKVNSSIAG